MMSYKFILFLCFCVLTNLAVHAQKADGTVKSLTEADEELNNAFSKYGVSKAFVKYAATEAKIFNPSAVSIKTLYSKNNQKNTSEKLEWKPEYAIISKKGDLGVTSGRFELKEADTTKHGYYLNVWQNDNKKWKLLYHGKTFQPYIAAEIRFDYYEPADKEFYKMIGPQKLQMRNDIVFSTDELFGKRLSSPDGNKNLSEFYDSGVRVFFPGKQPVYSLEQALDLVVKHHLKFRSIPEEVVRAFSGDLAFTWGNAMVSEKGYSYLRAWKIDETTGKWNVIVDMFVE